MYTEIQNNEVVPTISEADTGLANGNMDPVLAYGLAPLNDWTPQLPFIDIMKIARPWIGHEPNQWGGQTAKDLEEAGLLDEDGWPITVPDELDRIGTVWSFSSRPDDVDTRAGTYVLQYEGEGEISLSSVDVISSSPGEITFEYDGSKNIRLDIITTDPENTGNNIRNISIVQDKHLELFEAGAIFNPDWTALVEDSRQLRFMDWMETNGSEQGEWADRPQLDDYAWSAAGAPVEIMVRLANELGTDPWFTVPHNATEEYVREFATYVRDNLDPQLKAHVEYSNEIWNWNFGQAQDLLQQVNADWGNGDVRGYYVKRATETMQIWDDVFDTESESRLVKVLSGQTANTWLSDSLLSAKSWFTHEPDDAVSPSEVFDAFAVTTYFGSSTIKDPEYLEELLTAIKDPEIDANAYLADRLLDPNYESSIPLIAQALQEQAALAADVGLDLIAYEGGQHVHHRVTGRGLSSEDQSLVQSFMVDFVRSDEMASLYQELWDVWSEVGDGPFMQFVDVGRPGTYGSWGTRTSISDETPRSELLDSLNSTESRWWADDRADDTFQHGLTAIGSNLSDTLTGTAEDDYLIAGGGDDVLIGSSGNDGLHGGDGFDIVELTGLIDDYRIEEFEGYQILHGPDGVDRLVSIEQLRFSDGLIAEPSSLKGYDPEEPGYVRSVYVVAGSDAGKAFQIEGVGQFIAAEVGEVEVGFGDAGVRIDAVNRWSPLGKELGLQTDPTQNGYVIIEHGKIVEFDGQELKASYYSVQHNMPSKGGGNISETALETALQFGAVVNGVDEIIGTNNRDIFVGRNNSDHFIGAAGNDNLRGAGGADILMGGEGNDVLVGGKGDDWISGGEGSDRFVFKVGDGVDEITDFTIEDKLDLRQMGLDSEFDFASIATEDANGNLTLDFGSSSELVLLNHNLNSLVGIELLI